MAANKTYYVPIIRFLAFVFTLVATVLMGINRETTTTSFHIFQAHFTYWGAFEFFVIAYAIATAYNSIVMFCPLKTPLWRLVFLLDWFVTTLMITSCGMATNSYLEMKNGVVEAGWSPLCCIVPGFCNKVFISLIFGFLGIVVNVPVFAYSINVLANPFLLQNE